MIPVLPDTGNYPFANPYDYPYDVRAAIEHITSGDAQMRAHVASIGEYRLPMRPSYNSFQALLYSIVFQQVSGAAARTVYRRLRLISANGRLPTAPGIDRISDDQLRTCGLSGQKLSFIRALTQTSINRQLPSLNQLQSMTDAEIRQTLISIHGVGEWTIQMLLIFHLGRPDVLPTGDLAIRRGHGLVYSPTVDGNRKQAGSTPTPTALLAFGERWRPYRTVASWYLWRAVAPARATS